MKTVFARESKSLLQAHLLPLPSALGRDAVIGGRSQEKGVPERPAVSTRKNQLTAHVFVRENSEPMIKRIKHCAGDRLTRGKLMKFYSY
ncbi:MAG: hypothetical protein VKO39_13530 [Cyanobacteriota bacterium]|nr:hypothetical protein [Cyanobacteriota bacterium]